MKGTYDDIIDLPHPDSPSHPRMSAHERAAQFSPFAALTGYGDEVKETARLTDKKMDLDDTARGMLDWKLSMIEAHIPLRPSVSILYFKPDERKEGGACVTVSGYVKKIDHYKHMVVLEDGCRIPVQDILKIESEELPLFEEHDR